jgi:AcrR family transcriptional regulator
MDDGSQRQAVTLPAEDPLAELPATAQRILAAARRLLTEQGFVAVTLEKVAAEAGVNKASIRYHFGNKAGLVANVVELMLHEELAGAQPTSDVPPAERVHGVIEGKRRIIATTDSFGAFFEILPHAVREDGLRRRLAASYPWWAEQNLRLLGLEGAGPEGRNVVIAGLGRLLSAATDGVSVQKGLDPESSGPDAALAALEFLIAAAMPRLQALADGDTD